MHISGSKCVRPVAVRFALSYPPTHRNGEPKRHELELDTECIHNRFSVCKTWARLIISGASYRNCACINGHPNSVNMHVPPSILCLAISSNSPPFLYSLTYTRVGAASFFLQLRLLHRCTDPGPVCHCAVPEVHCLVANARGEVPNAFSSSTS